MERIDRFFNEQPPLKFIDELRSPLFTKKPKDFGKRKMKSGEISAMGCYLDFDFPDEKGYLETSVSDFEGFIGLFEIGGADYKIKVRYGITPKYESYYIKPHKRECEIIASDTEGVRRALVYLQDEFIRREGAFLPDKEIYRAPSVKTRITRGFFSPTNRPPKNGDELFDDIDYYPDEYLNRLMHDGTNGIWIYTSFKALMSSRYFPEFGEGGEKRIEKLRSVVKKCLRYGIKTYVFAIEPMNLNAELAAAHPEVLGADPWIDPKFPDVEIHPFCPSTEVGRAYILEATEKLFRLVPELGGYMDITEGERWTSCVASRHFASCPRCSKDTPGKALSKVVNLIKEGIRRAGTGAEFISWTYGHRSWDFKDIREYVRNTDDDIMIMQNFDDMGYPEQLGRKRMAVDYWLSYVGPSPLFTETADEAKKYGKHMFAKMQVCCSHELATVPYVPTPGILFDKYKGAREWNVEGILQCWYFGNYPSIMSKAAGELSFIEDFSDKDAFVRYLAATYFGESRAEAVARAWKLFEEAYINYPVNIMFSYYGPMHDGVVWELALLPKDNILPRTWLLLDPPDGDRIFECLWYGHTLDEAILLAEKMKSSWREGMKHLSLVKDSELYTLSEAIAILFDSGYNILKFYKLRDELGYGRGEAKKILSEMRSIVEKEKENSRLMIDVCLADCRLGYHSEAEGFKFFPKKLRWRIESLERLLRTEFPIVEERLEKGLMPLEFYLGEKDGKPVADAYIFEKCDIEKAKLDAVPDTDIKVRCSYDDSDVIIQFISPERTSHQLTVEFILGQPSPAVDIQSGRLEFEYAVTMHQSVHGDMVEKMKAMYRLDYKNTDGEDIHTVRISHKDSGWNVKSPIRVRLGSGPKTWQKSESIIMRLGKDDCDPIAYKWVLPKA